MVDNIAVTPGVGATVAADDVGGALYQRVKLAVGADGAAADLAPGQAAMAASLPVVLASDQTDVKVTLDSEAVVLGAGSAAVGDVTVTCPDIVVTITPTCDTSAYAAGDLIFDSTAIANAVRANGGTAILQSIVLADQSDQGVAMTLLFANAETDFGTLNAAPDPTDAEALTVIGSVAVVVADYVDLILSRVATVKNIGLLLKAGAATTSIYVAAINGTGTPTLAADGLVLQIGLLRS